MGTGTQSVRLPGHKQLRELIAKTGPIISTSANLQGEPVSHNLAQARKYFGDQLDFYVDAGVLKGEPSTIVRSKNGSLEVVRAGACKI